MDEKNVDSFKAPSAAKVLKGLDSRYYETSPNSFDCFNEALAGLEFNHNRANLSEGLNRKMEEIDLQRDAVSIGLTAEVSRNSDAIIEGVESVLGIDLDISRTQLYINNLRRRLAACQSSSCDSKLSIANLQLQLKNIREVQRLVDQLHFVAEQMVPMMKEEKEAEELSSIISKTRFGLQNVKTFEHNTKLVAVSAAKEAMVRSMGQFETRAKAQMKRSFLEGKDAYFVDALTCFNLLEKKNVPSVVEEVWTVVVEEIMFSDSPFRKLGVACTTFEDAMQHIKSNSNLKRNCFQLVVSSIEHYLASPEIRNLTLVLFSQTIRDATAFVQQKLGVKFFMQEDMSAKTKLEGGIRLRSRIYAQSFQAEGFQAMKALMLRETWVNVSETNSLEFVQAIFLRLNLTDKPLATSTTTPSFVLTATLASGMPRQVQRTLDLMKSLPQSAAGEAFLGLQIVFDLYLFTICSVFLPKLFKECNALEDASKIKDKVVLYLHSTKESLKEWINTKEEKLCESDEGLVDQQLSVPCIIAERSLIFLSTLVNALEAPLSHLLPSIERSKLTTRMFVDLPRVLNLMQSRLRRGAIKSWLTPSIAFPPELIVAVYQDKQDKITQFARFHPVLNALKARLSELQRAEGIDCKPVIWDEALAAFLDRFLNGLAKLPKCTVLSRGSMALHLASFWETFESFPYPPGKRAMISKARVDEFIKAYYFESADELFAWMRRSKDLFDASHFTNIFEIGMLGQQYQAVTSSFLLKSNGTGRALTNSKRELKVEFDKLLASFNGAGGSSGE